MKLSRSAIAIYLGVVFLSGGALGFYANRLYAVYGARTVPQTRPAQKGPEAFRKGLVSFYKDHLQLTDDQVQKLEFILDDTRAQVQAEHERSRPEMERVHQEQVRRINEMLTPDQRNAYAKMLEDRERLRQQKKNGRPGGPGL
jgi:hypothetical protein